MSLIYTIFGYPLGWIMWACFKVLPIYGVALVLFTLIVRVCLVPLSIKQQKSMVKMQICLLYTSRDQIDFRIGTIL